MILLIKAVFHGYTAVSFRNVPSCFGGSLTPYSGEEVGRSSSYFWECSLLGPGVQHMSEGCDTLSVVGITPTTSTVPGSLTGHFWWYRDLQRYTRQYLGGTRWSREWTKVSSMQGMLFNLSASSLASRIFQTKGPGMGLSGKSHPFSMWDLRPQGQIHENE